MKITIPTEYRKHFVEGRVYAVRLPQSAILLMNKAESESFTDLLKETHINFKESLERFLRAGLIELSIKNGVVKVPEQLSDGLKENSLTFVSKKTGIKVF